MEMARPEPPSWPVNRRNSIGTPVVPAKLSLPAKRHSSSFPQSNGIITAAAAAATSSSSSTASSSSFPAVDFELVSLKSVAYTSLKDLIPSAGIQSPTAASPCGYSGCEISIRNRLVKQAAWAYLQPMSSSPASSSRHFFRCLWVRFSADCFRDPVTACLDFINRHIIPTITKALDRLLRAIRVGMTRRQYPSPQQ